MTVSLSTTRQILAAVWPEREVESSPLRARPKPWRFSTRGLAVRLFITCWLVYTMHFATNIVREIYPALALGDHLTFRVDEYANLHPDLFEKPGYGWHINNNPGASMLAAIPYAIARPIIDRIVERVRLGRIASGMTEPPNYNSPWPMAREFYKEAWRRGYDIKFGLAALVMQALCMAPISALGVVAMFYVLRQVFGSDKTALWLSLLYAFGTPIFFRTGFLNQNLLLTHIAFMGFVAMWDPSSQRGSGVEGRERWGSPIRFFLGGVAGGMALLMDYSGAVLLLGLFAYGLVKRWREASISDAARHGAWYVLGTLGPVGLLWFYQWKSFGNPFLPAQQWMAKVAYIEQGYQGVELPQPDLLLALLFDYRYGLFVSCPLFLLALAAWRANRAEGQRLEWLELWAMTALCVALWIFFSGVNYSRLQFNSGIRYMVPAFPLLFILAAIVLVRLPRIVIYFVAVAAVTEAWCMAMYRDVERGLGVLDPLLNVFIGGFRLPVLTTLSNLGGHYGGFSGQGVSPLPLFALLAVILYGLWSTRFNPVTSHTRY